MYTNTFEEFFRITTNMVDENDYLKLSSILDIAQNIAGDHATELKIGFNEFIKKDLIWVLIRNKVEIVKNIHDPKIIKAVTYPLKPRFIEYPREVLLYVNDELICKIHQVWCIYNIKDNNVVSYKMDDYVSNHPSLFDGRVKKLITSKDLTYIKASAQSNNNILGNFVKTSVMVYGDNDLNLTEYKVYTYTPSTAWGNNDTLTISTK